jgi:hypothetical protein
VFPICVLITTGSVQCYLVRHLCLVRRLARLLTHVSDSIAAGLNVTTVQFQNWNPNIIGLCDAVQAGQHVCKSPPGTTGTYTLAPPLLGTDADAGNQQQGGSGKSVHSIDRSVLTILRWSRDSDNDYSAGAFYASCSTRSDSFGCLHYMQFLTNSCTRAWMR